MLVTLVGCSENKKDVNNEENNQQEEQVLNESSNQIKQEEKVVQIKGVKRVGDIEISNIEITLVEKNKCMVTADVKNVTSEYIEPTNVRLKITDESGEAKEIFGGIITELAGYEASTFTTYILKDITYAQDIEISIISEIE